MSPEKTRKKRYGGSPTQRFDGKKYKYNYQGTPFGYKNRNTLKSEYKNAKRGSDKYERLQEWKRQQREKYSTRLEPEPEMPTQSIDYGAMPPPHPKSVEARRRSLDDDQLEFLRGIRESDSVQDIDELPFLPDDLIQKFLDEIVFKNEPRGPMNPERCRRLREFCQLYPRTCAFNEDFKRAFVYPCSKRGRQLRDPGSYREYLDFMEALPELRRDVERYKSNPYVLGHQNRRYGSPHDNQRLTPYRYIEAYLTPTELNRRSRKLGIMGKQATGVISDVLKNYYGMGYYGIQWEQLRQGIYNNPDILHDIISEFKVKLQELRKPNGEPYYTERTIDRIIKRFIEELYD